MAANKHIKQSFLRCFTTWVSFGMFFFFLLLLVRISLATVRLVTATSNVLAQHFRVEETNAVNTGVFGMDRVTWSYPKKIKPVQKFTKQPGFLGTCFHQGLLV